MKTKTNLNKLEVCAMVLKSKINRDINNLEKEHWIAINEVKNVIIHESNIGDSNLLVEVDWDITLKNVIGYRLLEVDRSLDYIVDNFISKIKHIIAIAEG